MELRERLEAYTPYNEQEERDREAILRRLGEDEDVLTRDNLCAHMTASAWVTNAARTRVLMAYHNLYRSWSWLGGHADGDADLLRVALREVREESGLKAVAPVTEEIFSLEILTVDGHEKKGRYVPSHLHLNVTYLLEADEAEPTRAKPDENSGVRWFELEEAVAACSEPWFRERVYAKLNEKLRRYRPRADAGDSPCGCGREERREELLRGIAPCSLLCHTCGAYGNGVIRRHAAELRRWLEGVDGFYKAHAGEGNHSVLERFRIFDEELQRYGRGPCGGCRAGGHTGCGIAGCFVPECALKQGVDFCGECPRFPCEKTAELFEPEVYGQWLAGGRAIRELGAEAYWELRKEQPHYLPYGRKPRG